MKGNLLLLCLKFQKKPGYQFDRQERRCHVLKRQANCQTKRQATCQSNDSRYKNIKNIRTKEKEKENIKEKESRAGEPEDDSNWWEEYLKANGEEEE